MYHAMGAAITNFDKQLPVPQGRLAQELLKGNYDFGFVALPEEYDEEALETAIEQRMTRFLLELGEGWAFVGRQKEIIVSGKTRKISFSGRNVAGEFQRGILNSAEICRRQKPYACRRFGQCQASPALAKAGINNKASSRLPVECPVADFKRILGHILLSHLRQQFIDIHADFWNGMVTAF